MKTMTFLNLIREQKCIIHIPRIQRDYAQGRELPHETDVRKHLLQAMDDSLQKGKTLHLGVIYGEYRDNDNAREFLPFDGQQRLTSLFLLHWYAAVQAGKDRKFLQHFQYEVREHAHRFVNCLCTKNISVESDKSPEELISAQGWFNPDWENDPTVKGMLTMLHDIHKQFKDMDKQMLWERLEEELLVFHFAELKDLDTGSEELFIKMNARGKQLTEFEHLKARLLNSPSVKRGATSEQLKNIEKKLDTDWQELFWHISKKQEDRAVEADAALVRFLTFLADMFCSDTKEECLFERLCRAFDDEGRPLLENCSNLDFMINVLDVRVEEYRSLKEQAPNEKLFFHDYVTDPKGDSQDSASPGEDPAEQNIPLFDSTTPDPLGELCCKDSSLKNYKASYMLLALLLARIRKDSRVQIMKRLRIARNLIEYTDFDKSKHEARVRALVKLMCKGELEPCSVFDEYQFHEEQAKYNLLRDHKEDRELRAALNHLEDNNLLHGRIAVFSEESEEDSQKYTNTRTTWDYWIVSQRPDSNRKNFIFKRERLLLARPVLAALSTADGSEYDEMLRALLSRGVFALRYRSNYYLTRMSMGKEDLPVILTSTDDCTFRDVRHCLQSLLEKLRCDFKDNLPQLMDAPSHETLVNACKKIADSWLEEEEKEDEKTKFLSWRWYFVRYRAMRPDPQDGAGTSCYKGNYYIPPDIFLIEHVAGKKRFTGKYRSPFIHTLLVESREKIKDLEIEEGNDGSRHYVRFGKIRMKMEAGRTTESLEQKGSQVPPEYLWDRWLIQSENGEPLPHDKITELVKAGELQLQKQGDDAWSLPIPQEHPKDVAPWIYYDTEDRIKLALNCLDRMKELGLLS